MDSEYEYETARLYYYGGLEHPNDAYFMHDAFLIPVRPDYRLYCGVLEHASTEWYSIYLPSIIPPSITDNLEFLLRNRPIGLYVSSDPITSDIKFLLFARTINDKYSEKHLSTVLDFLTGKIVSHPNIGDYPGNSISSLAILLHPNNTDETFEELGRLHTTFNKIIEKDSSKIWYGNIAYTI